MNANGSEAPAAGSQSPLDAYCYHCGADWSDWPTLSEEQRERTMAANFEARPGRLYDVPPSCPSCGFAYYDEDDDGP